MKEYVETFEDGAGGWIGWDQYGLASLERRAGALVSRSPWWVDYNHAPPGAGYLHILFGLYTKDGTRTRGIAGENRFVAGGFPTDFTDARITVRLCGEVEAAGAQLVLLAQADVPGPPTARVNSVLTGQPLRITPDWSEQTLTCAPDDTQWTCLGSRHDRRETYGWAPIAPVLRDLNCDVLFVLFPLDVVPAAPVSGALHRPRAGLDYAVDTTRLPRGRVMLDQVRIAFPQR